MRWANQASNIDEISFFVVYFIKKNTKDKFEHNFIFYFWKTKLYK